MTDPHIVTSEQVYAALAALGITDHIGDITRIRMDTRCITVVRHVRDTAGRIPIYGGQPVTRTTAIAIEWNDVEPSDVTAIGVTPR